MVATNKTKVAWITGASSGIGRAVALRLAQTGYVVAISARSTDKLAALVREHKNIRPFPVDVTKASDVADTVRQVEAELGKIDLAILNAGIWQPMMASTFDTEKAWTSMAVNYGGVINALEPVMRSMMRRRSGHIALTASVAGYRGLPVAAAYGPSKAALISLAESLYPDLRLMGVKLSVINPGFVATPLMAGSTFPRPYIVLDEFAADAIVHGLDSRRFEIVFPWQIWLLMKTLRLLPYRIYFWLTGKISSREQPFHTGEPPQGGRRENHRSLQA